MRAFLISVLVLVWGQTSFAQPPKVVTDIAPVHALVALVMGNVGAPELLLPQGADAHDFQLRPSQAVALADADLVIWVGPEMSPWLERTLEGLGLGAAVALLDASETQTRSYDAGHDEHAHDNKAEAQAGHDGHDDAGKKHDDHAHDDKAEAHADNDGHDHSGVDPHAWLSPENARIWVRLIAEALAKTDPTHAAEYAANAEAAKARISAVEAEVVAVLAPVVQHPFAVTHDAYGYFAARFGVQIVGSLRTGDAALPGAGSVTGLQTALTDTGAVCIFAEVNHDNSSAQQMATATGTRMGGALDPEGSMLTPGPTLYGDLMLGLAKTIAECLTTQ